MKVSSRYQLSVKRDESISSLHHFLVTSLIAFVTEATRETDELLRRNLPIETPPKETTVRQKDSNRGLAAGSFTSRTSSVSNSKATTYWKIDSDQANELSIQAFNIPTCNITVRKRNWTKQATVQQPR
ncbi:hypothetical protein AVEN_238757-1 [Araneus ventricosus]|uniref:Uncharacterized protein n=1 Tax=Araneus ventricosus TaxID=182803 RepID=A0A4Y2LI31_ARAVE|nr:hypothetical protein AVEN_238757-1 [Araneus ventricosus]